MGAITICSDFGAQKIKSDTVSTVSPVSPSIGHEVMGPDVLILVDTFHCIFYLVLAALALHCGV